MCPAWSHNLLLEGLEKKRSLQSQACEALRPSVSGGAQRHRHGQCALGRALYLEKL